MSTVVENVSFIDKILMCICCIDEPSRSDLPNNDQFNEQSIINQCANLSSDSNQVSQNYSTIGRCTRNIQQTHNFVRVSPTPSIARPKPKVQRNCNLKKVVEVPAPIHGSSRKVYNTSNIVQVPPTTAPQVAKQDHSTIEQYNRVQIPPSAAVAPSIVRSTINDHHTWNNSHLNPTPAETPQVAKQPYNFPQLSPTASAAPPTARSATNVHNTNNVVYVHPIVAPQIVKPKVQRTLESQNGLPKVYGIVPEPVPPLASTFGKPPPNLNNHNGSSSCDNSKLQQDLTKLEASIKHFKHSKRLVPQALKTKFDSQEEFQQCIAIHLGKGACDSHSSSSSLDELDEEYYINRPRSIFTVQQQNCTEYDNTNVQQAASGAMGTQGNNAGKQKKKKKKKKKYYKKKKNTIQSPNNVPL